MLWPTIIFAVCYLLIATDMVDKTVVAILGAAVAVAFRQIGYEEALSLVDLNVIFLLTGMMIIVEVLARTGVFEWTAVKVARAASGNGVVIVLVLFVLTAVISAFLDNVTTVILMAPISIFLCQILEIPAPPVLIMEAVFSNIGGTATLVGDPPNVLIGSSTPLNFNDFILNLGPVVVLILLVSTVAARRLFTASGRTTSRVRSRIAKARPELAIVNPRNLRRALIVFGLVLLGFFFGHFIGLEPGLVALAGGILMLLVCGEDVHSALARVEWNTIFFFVGLFILVGMMETHGIFSALGNGLLSLTHGRLFLTAAAVLWGSAFLSAIVDNIPLVMAMIPLIKTVAPQFTAQLGATPGTDSFPAAGPVLFWALALGACLGGNGSLVGASANVVIAQVAKRNNYELTFWGFTKYGLPFMVLSTTIATAYMYVRYFLFQ